LKEFDGLKFESQQIADANENYPKGQMDQLPNPEPIRLQDLRTFGRPNKPFIP
jgi:hypothetical protein